MQDQIHNDMDLERERGITIKSHPVRMTYRAKDGSDYCFNLIDTPGHVDFSYEASRSLAACEGAVLVVDASQGIEAQTLTNVYLALGNDLEIIPVMNKIDLPGRPTPTTWRGRSPTSSALTQPRSCGAVRNQARGVDAILERIVAAVPPPAGSVDWTAQGPDIRFEVRPVPRRRGVRARVRRPDQGTRHGEVFLSRQRA